MATHVWVQAMWELTKKLDPTRLVEDMSVCHWQHLDYYAHGDTDINAWHFYIDDYQRAKEHINNVVNSTYVGSSFNYVPGYKHRGQPLINSEYGGVGALDGDRDISWSFKFLTNELRRQGKISAYIYTELHDVEWEYNGLLNYDRTKKEFGYSPTLMNASNVLTVDAPPVSRVAPGEMITLPVASSHFSVHRLENVSLTWRVGGVDTFGRWHRDLQRGEAAIPFPHHQVSAPHQIVFRAPEDPILCIATVEAVLRDGSVVARNFVDYLVSKCYPPAREALGKILVLRQPPHAWTNAMWSDFPQTRDQAQSQDVCFGHGFGFFEWIFPLPDVDLQKIARLKVLCEASSCRRDSPQTDADLYPTTFQVLLNDVPIHRIFLPNHPHDSRGVLSYLRGSHGAYGYLISCPVEGESLQKILAHTTDHNIRLSCAVPAEGSTSGGLTIYGAESGRYPICPTLLIEWLP